MNNDIDQFFKDLVLTWRKQKNNLEGKIFEENEGFFNFHEPTQFFIFEFLYKSVVFYTIFKSHFSEIHKN